MHQNRAEGLQDKCRFLGPQKHPKTAQEPASYESNILKED